MKCRAAGRNGARGETEKFFEMRRTQLVEYMRGSGAVRSKSVADAFLAVRREDFVPEEARADAYADEAVAIGFGQTISQPSTIAIMLEMLDAQEGQKVLEVGAGCGYVLALLSHIVGGIGGVFGIEIVDELLEICKKNLEKTGAGNAEVVNGDGTLGLRGKGQFDRILLSAACPYVPKPLWEQLAERGAIVAPVGDRWAQSMVRVRKFRGEMMKDEYLGTQFAFVPLRGEFGWK
ncbi:MAG: protein-L-isoaspartate(D-aspartate) O-methyltransferase [Candidatus Diapherotrites archaeon]